MLVLTRSAGGQIMIGDNIILTVVEVSRKYVRLGIDAPKDVRILRKEIYGNQGKSKEDPAQSSVVEPAGAKEAGPA